MIFGNLFSSDLLLLTPSFFLIITILLIIVYSVFTSKYLFSRFLVEDVLLKVSFSLFLFLLLLFNQVSSS
jgi:hypothetical protein